MNMKKKTSRIVVSVIAVIAVVVALCGNRVLTRIVCAELDKSIAKIDSIDIRYGDVKLLVLSGHVWINDVYLQTDTLYSQPDSTRPMTRVEVEQMSIDGVNYLRWLIQRRVQVRGITIRHPHITSWIKSKDKEDTVIGEELRQQLEHERTKKQEEAMALARVFVEEAMIDRITIDHAQVQVGDLASNLRTHVEDASAEIFGIGYSFIDSIPYHYNDSVFHFDIRNVDVVLPDGKTSLHCDGMTARPGGIVRIDTTRVESYLSLDHKQFVKGQLSGLRIGGFDVQKFNQTKSLDVRSIHIDQPNVQAHISTLKQPKAKKSKRVRLLELERAESLRQQQEKQLEEIRQQVMMFLTEVNIDTIKVHDVCGQVRSTSDYLCAGIDSLSLGVYGIGYSLLDSIPYHYNDSVYEFSLGSASIITPDSLVKIQTTDMRYTNGGAFRIGPTHIQHTMGMWDLSRRKDYTPQAWINLQMRELRTSHKNVVREAMTLEDGFALDSVHVIIDRMFVAKDARYKPKKPYPILQEAMLSVNYPFHIRRLDAEVKDLEVHLATQDTTHVGCMTLGPLHANVRNITAVPNQTIHVDARGQVGKGKLKMGMDIVVNRAGDWAIDIDARDLNLHFLDQFLYPIAGMNIGCDIQHLQTQYRGDGVKANGTLCMEYTNLSVEATKDSPIPAVRNMSGLINSFARTCLPHENPKTPGAEPRAYKTQWKRDPMAEPVLFFLGPLINGVVETMLPGLFVANKVSADSTTKEKREKSRQ